MKVRGRRVCLVCAIAALALPAGAAAKPGYYVSKPGQFVVMDLRGSNGYGITISSGDPKHITLFANKDGMGVGYRTRGRVTNDSVEATFGNRGRVSVRFQPVGSIEAAEIPSHCKGRQGTAEKERFVGSIRFQGEHGFTRVLTKGARGNVFRIYRQVCKRERHPRHYKRPPTSSLSASSSNPHLPWFSVFKEEPRAHHDLFFSEEANYRANQSEHREGMLIDRTAIASAPPETFPISAPGTSPVTATVAPPSPFSGTATYEREANGTNTWTGDLAVELPGVGQVPLTGPAYATRLCRNFGCACPPHDKCDFVVIASGRPYARLLQHKTRSLR